MSDEVGVTCSSATSTHSPDHNLHQQVTLAQGHLLGATEAKTSSLSDEGIVLTANSTHYGCSSAGTFPRVQTDAFAPTTWR
jgi:hypothetical protein